ncbi:MAG: hypothetical protein HYZ14_04300, partial [Bacteroidetes bacterium]|nr:hypothetical protein [Bacteroidota bacterium]
MKNTLLIILFMAFTGLLTHAQDTTVVVDSGAVDINAVLDHAFDDLDFTEATTGFLFDRGFCYFDESLYPGDTLDTTNFGNKELLITMYASMFNWQLNDQGLASLASYKNSFQNNNEAETLAVSIIHAQYNRFKPNIIDDNLISVSNNQYHDVVSRPESPYTAHHAVAASTYHTQIANMNPVFYFPSSLFINKSGLSLQSLQVDFDDGNGYQTVSVGSYKSITYTIGGEKEIRYKLNYSGSLTYTAHSKLEVIDLSILSYAAVGDFQEMFEPDPGILGFFGHAGAIVTVAYGCGHDESTGIRKPLIIIEGYDPVVADPIPLTPGSSHVGVGLDFHFIWGQLLAAENSLETEIEDASYDLVFIDFMNGVDQIQRNARVVEEVIEWVNQEKAANGSTEPNTVIGFSMGGIVGRWALRTMENNNIDHDTRLFVSYDSPHRGAYVPLAYQYMIRHLDGLNLPGGLGLADVFTDFAEVVDMINAPVNSQLLLYQDPGSMPTRGSVSTTYTNRPVQDNITFLQQLDNLGYPEQCRVIAVANGSQINVEQAVGGTPIADNGLLFEIQNNLGFFTPQWFVNRGVPVMRIAGADVDFQLFALPDINQGNQIIYSGRISFDLIGLGRIDLINSMVTVNGSDCMENKPGGVFDLAAFGIDLSTAGVPGLNEPVNRFCFIPTVSSLDIDLPSGQGYNYHVQNGDILNPSNKQTPFCTYIAPDGSITGAVDNELHVDLTLYNTALLIDEAIDGPVPIIQNTTYNIGHASEFSVPTIVGDLEIRNNGTLYINKHDEIGFASSGNPDSDDNSHLSVYVLGGEDGCSSKELVVESGGTIEIGDIVNGNTGNLIIENGGNVIFESGSSLIIQNGSQIMVKNGGNLTFEDNVSIVLSGSNATLEIHGTLELAPNATFTFTGSGKVIFNGAVPNNIQFGAGSSIEIMGNGPGHVAVEIHQAD